ncbi:MotE family protein [Agrobacterium rubi]|nr:MotE family protein [Agrobacterium rubi]MBP1879056.1 flagellar motility protein MotE (MotC chaperone) [Agrobacterium rubi]MCL6652376.1 flagellar protein [Agrobacterium rubi]NTF06480.1 MotE family protein [Agrobacterium rubi]NTF18722.1 MotE family protein [Agrobacterium rubi]NTF25685.1 MotE family protein [Agrobacterium rubi]
MAKVFEIFTPRRVLLAVFVLTAALPSAKAQEQVRVTTGETSGQEIQQYCTNIVDQARDQRYLLQKQDLEKLQADVDNRIAVMEARKAEYEDWLKRRNDFMQQAEANLVNVYKTMKADAAAPQLEQVNPGLAAAIIMKLPPRQSSLILAEMDAKKAATVASIMSSATDKTTSRDPS